MERKRIGKGTVIAALLALVIFMAGVALQVLNGEKSLAGDEVSNEASVEISVDESVVESSVEASTVEVSENKDSEENENFFPSVSESENQLVYQCEVLDHLGMDQSYLDMASLDITKANEYFADFMQLYKAGDSAFLDYVVWEEDEEDWEEDAYENKAWKRFLDNADCQEAWKIMTSYVEIRIDPRLSEEDYEKQPLFLFAFDYDYNLIDIEVNPSLQILLKDYYKMQYVENAHVRPDVNTYGSYADLMEEFKWADEKIKPEYFTLRDFFFVSMEDLSYRASGMAFIEDLYGEDNPDTVIDYDYVNLGQTQGVAALLDHLITPDRNDLLDLTKDNKLSEEVQPYLTIAKLCEEGKYVDAVNTAIDAGLAPHFSEEIGAKYEAMTDEQKAEVDSLMEEMGAPIFAAYYEEADHKLELTGYATSLRDNGDGTYYLATERFTTSFAESVNQHSNEMFKNIFEPFESAVYYVEANHK